MTESTKILSHQEVVSNAGKARAKSLSPERRIEIARKAGLAKGTKNLPKATHAGILSIGDKNIACGVLPGGIRVISNSSLRNALGLASPSSKNRKKAAEVQLPTFLASNALRIYQEQVFGGETATILYVNKDGAKIEGMEATNLPKICEVYLLARSENALSKQQMHIAASAEIIMRGLAKIGIIALVDESSGFQEERARNELQTLLQKFISEDLLQWTQKFPHQFFREVYRLHGWLYREGQCRHPHYLGKFINKYVYESISPEVLQELKNKNPIIEDKSRRGACHHQFLTPEVGQPALDKHLLQTIALMKASNDKEQFDSLFGKVFN